MTLRIGINGFGRIGRLALRAMIQRKNIECVAINYLVPSSTLAHLLKYDSAHGRFQGEVSASETALTVNGRAIAISSEKDPTLIPWKKHGVDVVFECTGIFTQLETAQKHLEAGAKKVIISAPAKGDVPTFVMGVNHQDYHTKEHHVVSNASCTTNCLAPVVKVLHESFGIERGFMTTIHSYTNDQNVVDAPHKDLRRARAAAASQIPTTTGAAKAVGLVLPALKGKLDGMAIRVPTINVSCVDLVATLKNPATAEDINAKLKAAAQGPLKGILAFVEDECVSVDFMGNTHSSLVDAPSTRVIDNMVKVLAWYDNEMGFSCRMLDLAEHMGRSL
ncbi:MAG: type I glyceraldehyde-3-phosphate dehydrogenase [Deltaproteobacteria bacterium]|nr:type I glyceraldehyde-3-phosphate dehydrogenase [Deltaproteobacteria bacterium]